MNTLNLVIKNLFRKKTRFLFTLLGIVIGMASFVALLSLGGNMRSEVTRQAEAMGANLMIMPDNMCVFNQIALITGETISESLSFDVFERINEIEGITVVPYLTQRASVRDTSSVVIGVLPEETKSFRGWELAEGIFFTEEDINTVVLGYQFAESRNLNVADIINIRGEYFTVIGVLSLNQSNDDSSLFMKLEEAQRIFERGGVISYMSAIVDDMNQMDYYIAAILNTGNIQVATDEQLLTSVLTILGSVNVTLQLIAGVALIAAAFGMINTMMTAVYERRREIGIMRAIGSKRRDVFKIFIIESALYGLIGGIIGVTLGLSASYFAGDFISRMGANEMLKGITAEASFDINLILLSVLFSVVIAIIAGLYPAVKASNLTPMEAINYE